MAKVFVFVPAFNSHISGTTFEATHALMSALASKGIIGHIGQYSFPDIEQLRNMILSYWYDVMADFTHLLFIDADVGFRPEMVLDMLTFNEPVVGGIYPKKTFPIDWVGSGLGAADYRKGFIEVEGLGGGCLLIRRDAITAMIEKFPEMIADNMTLVDLKNAGAVRTLEFFDRIKTPQGKVSEDISFCRRWRETGGKVWASTAYVMDHEGPYRFSACFAKEREATAAARAEAAE